MNTFIETNTLRNAKRFALRYHKHQLYGNEFPYAIHLQAVESVLLRFGVKDETLRVAAWLHDVCEDTPATYEDVFTYFGADVADIVEALTEPRVGNRSERHKQTYSKIRKNQKFVIVKLADRIANVEAGGNKVGMYFKEHGAFKNALYSKEDNAVGIIIQTMWDHLESVLIEVQ